MKRYVSNDMVAHVLSCGITTTVILKRYVFSRMDEAQIDVGTVRTKKGMDVFQLIENCRTRLLPTAFNDEMAAHLVALSVPAAGSSNV